MGQEIVAIEQDILYPVVLCDEKPLEGNDALFIFSRDDGEEEIAELAASIYIYARDHDFLQDVPWIVINGTTQEQWNERSIKFGGMEMWRRLLLENYVREMSILTTEAAYHTGAEADEFVRIAKERMLKTVTIVAMPYHILRCFLTIVKAMGEARHYLDVYSVTLPSLLWRKPAPKVLLGGSFEEGTRLDHIAGEHARIHDYTAKGFCATRDEALAYLARRGKK